MIKAVPVSSRNRLINQSIILSLLVLCAIIARMPGSELTKVEPEINISSLVPKQFGKWTFVEPGDSRQFMPVLPDGGYAGAFRNSDGFVLTMLVKFESDFRRRNEHLPDYCHRARGDRTELLDPMRLRLGLEKNLSIQSMEWKPVVAGTPALCGYWLTVDGHTVKDVYDLKFRQLVGGVLGLRKPVYLTRIDSFYSGLSTKLSRKQHQELILAFIEDFYRAARLPLRSTIFGT